MQPGQRLHAELRGLVDVPKDLTSGFLGPVLGKGILGLGQDVIREHVRQGLGGWTSHA
jgi:hypothetical protein